MKTHRLVLLIVFALAAGHALAQTPPPKPPAPPKAPPAPAATPQPAPVPPPAPPAPPVRKEGQPINIRVDTTITEMGVNAPPIKKTVTAVAGDGFDASVREVATVGNPVPGQTAATSLNVDVSPTILPNGKIRVHVTLQYSAGQAEPPDKRNRTDLRQTLVLNLENGKPLVITDASDPISDRRVTIEVTATILK